MADDLKNLSLKERQNQANEEIGQVLSKYGLGIHTAAHLVDTTQENGNPETKETSEEPSGEPETTKA